MGCQSTRPSWCTGQAEAGAGFAGCPAAHKVDRRGEQRAQSDTHEGLAGATDAKLWGVGATEELAADGRR